MGFPGDSVVTNLNLPANSGDAGIVGLIPVLGNSLEKEMTIHSNILAWKIPWKEKPGRLQSRGLQRGVHDLATEHTHIKSVAQIGKNWHHHNSFGHPIHEHEYPSIYLNYLISFLRGL